MRMTMLIRAIFLKDYQVLAENGPCYKKGQIVTLSAASFKHFADRGLVSEAPPDEAKQKVSAEGARRTRRSQKYDAV